MGKLVVRNAGHPVRGFALLTEKSYVQTAIIKYGGNDRFLEYKVLGNSIRKKTSTIGAKNEFLLNST